MGGSDFPALSPVAVLVVAAVGVLIVVVGAVLAWRAGRPDPKDSRPPLELVDESWSPALDALAAWRDDVRSDEDGGPRG